MMFMCLLELKLVCVVWMVLQFEVRGGQKVVGRDAPIIGQ